MKWVHATVALTTFIALSTMGGYRVHAQSTSADSLRREIEARFDIRPIRNGVLLLPRGLDRRVRSIEVTETSIAIDGALASGSDLRDKLGAADAGLVLRVLRLDADVRQQLAGRAPAVPSPPSVPAPPPPDQTAQPSLGQEPVVPLAESKESRRRGRSRSGQDRVRFGGSVAVEEGETVAGDVVAIGGSTRVDGEVTGDAVAIGGGLVLGPHADVHGDAVSIGGSFTRDPGARIGGKIVDLGGGSGLDFRQWGLNRAPRRLMPHNLFAPATGVFALMGTLMRVVVLCLLAWIVMFAGRDYVERIGARAAAEPLKAGAIGVLAQLLVVPVLVLSAIVFAITIIGIPLLLLIPFAILALIVVFIVGFTAVSYNIGGLVIAQFGWNTHNPYMTVATGIALLVSPVLVARLLGLADWLMFPITGTLVFVGVVLEYLAWTVGLGAVALMRFARPVGPPPPAPVVTV